MDAVLQAGSSTTDGAPPEAASFRQRAIQSVIWVVLGTPLTYGLRLGSSLVLTRLLFPDAFGLMATISAITSAVEMCSDFGIGQAVVQHRAGDTPAVLNSAWSLTVVRGLMLSLVVAALAWPSAWFFQEPILLPTILVASATLFIRGLTSPRALCWIRDLAQHKVVSLEIAANVIRIGATVLLAFELRSVWALVLGTLIGECCRSFGSYLIEPMRPRWCWDRQALRELVSFGRFIFLSTLLGFFAARLDTVCVAKFLGMQEAGLYYIGAMVAGMFGGVFAQVSGNILFPALSRHQHDTALLRRRTADILYLVILIALPACLVVIANADTILTLLYDERYHQAAQALQWLCCAACLTLLGDTLNAPLMATGRSYFGTLGTVARLVGFAVFAPLLGSRYGAPGYAAAVAASAGVFLLVMLVACAMRGHVSARRFGALLVLPAVFGALLLTYAAVTVPTSARINDRVVLLAVSTTGLALLWVWRRQALLRLISL